MKQKQLIKAIGLLGFALALLNCAFAFGNAGSTSFIQVFFVVVFAALVITAFALTKDAETSLPVLGSAAVYFGGMLVRLFFFAVDALVDFLLALRLDNLVDKRDYGDLTGDTLIKLNEKITNLREVISKDSFGEIIDVLCVLLAFSVSALVVFNVIEWIMKKDYSKTFVGKFVLKVLSVKNNCSTNNETQQNKEQEEAKTAEEKQPEEKQEEQPEEKDEN